MLHVLQIALQLVGKEETEIIFLHNEDDVVSKMKTYEQLGLFEKYFDKKCVKLKFFKKASDSIKPVRKSSHWTESNIVLIEDFQSLMSKNGSSRAIGNVNINDPDVLLILSSNHNVDEVRKIAFLCDSSSIHDSSGLISLWTFAKRFEAEVHIIFTQEDKQSEHNLWIDETERILDYYLHSVPYQYSVIDGTRSIASMQEYFATHDIDMIALSKNRWLNESKKDGDRPGYDHDHSWLLLGVN